MLCYRIRPLIPYRASAGSVFLQKNNNYLEWTNDLMFICKIWKTL